VKTDAGIQWTRLLPALSLAAIPPAYFLSAMTFLGDGEMKRSFAIMATILGSSWVLAMVGTLMLIVAMTRWSTIPLQTACYLLGATIVLLLPLVSVAAIVHGAPLVMPQAAKAGVAVPVIACLEGGLLGQPFGLFAGWIFWRLGFPVAAAHDSGRFSRSWSTLGVARLMLSLCLLPLLPAALLIGGTLYYSTHGYTDPLPPETLLSVAAWIGGTALIFATIGGVGFLVASSRGRQGRVTLASCLTLGGVVVLVLPFACIATGLVLETIVPAVEAAMAQFFAGNPFYENFTFLLAVGTIFTLLGIPGGWLLWQIGIAPAPRPMVLDTDLLTFD
jgi:hypothetical protein